MADLAENSKSRNSLWRYRNNFDRLICKQSNICKYQFWFIWIKTNGQWEHSTKN